MELGETLFFTTRMIKNRESIEVYFLKEHIHDVWFNLFNLYPITDNFKKSQKNFIKLLIDSKILEFDDVHDFSLSIVEALKKDIGTNCSLSKTEEIIALRVSFMPYSKENKRMIFKVNFEYLHREMKTPVRLKCFESPLNSSFFKSEELSNLKLNSYGLNLLMERRAQALAYDGALWIEKSKYVTQASFSNLVLLKKHSSKGFSLIYPSMLYRKGQALRFLIRESVEHQCIESLTLEDVLNYNTQQNYGVYLCNSYRFLVRVQVIDDILLELSTHDFAALFDRQKSTLLLD